MKDYSMHRLFLYFNDRELEAQFRAENDRRNRTMYKIASGWSALFWCSIVAILYASFPVKATGILPWILMLGFLPGLIGLVISYSKAYIRFWSAIGSLSILANLALSILIYVTVGDFSSYVGNLGIYLFVTFFLVRARFTHGALTTTIGTIGYTSYVYILDYVRTYDIQIYPPTFSVPLAIAIISGYAFESANRRNFVQNIVIEEQKVQIQAERERSEALLDDILPKEIATRLKAEKKFIADSHSQVSVLFADIVGFTTLSARLSAEEVVALLNEVFMLFDALVEARGLEKVKTIGDAYMVVAGAPNSNDQHAREIVGLAQEMVAAVEQYNRATGQLIALRIGINSGPVVAGVIGKKKFHYDLWGDTVNTASRMESHGLPGRIQLSQATRDLLGADFALEERGAIDIKGKGEMKAYLVKQAEN